MVIKECFENRKRMLRLAKYDVKALNSDTLLGFLWNFINPTLQIFIYWFVFSVGLRTTSPYGEYPYLVWMITGVIPWFYISGVLTSATISIHAYSGILKRMSFPSAIVPIKSVISAFSIHLVAMIIVYGIALFNGAVLQVTSIYILYFMISTLFFLFGYALLTSAITVLVKDFQKLTSSIVRLLFYISPIVWAQDLLPKNLRILLKLNPFDYLLNGYRYAILYPNEINLWNWQTAYFWTITVVLFIWGCNVHVRFRTKFFDLI